MSHLGALNGRGAAAPVPSRPIEAATVATTPGDVTDDVFVTLDDFDSTLRVGPVLGWRTVDEAFWPSRGNAAAVVRVHQGEYWFVGWEPS